MNLEISLCSLDNLHLGEDLESKTNSYPSLTPPILSISRSPSDSSFIHTLTQTHSDFLYISLSIRSTPSPITMTLVLPTYFLSPSLLLVLSVVLLSVLLSCLDVIYVMGCEVYLSPPLHTHTHTHTHWGAGSHFLGLSHPGSSAAQHPDPARVSRVCCVCENAGISEEYEGLKWNAGCLVDSQR